MTKKEQMEFYQSLIGRHLEMCANIKNVIKTKVELVRYI